MAPAFIARTDIGMSPCNEDDRDLPVTRGKLPLQIKPANYASVCKLWCLPGENGAGGACRITALSVTIE